MTTRSIKIRHAAIVLILLVAGNRRILAESIEAMIDECDYKEESGNECMEPPVSATEFPLVCVFRGNVTESSFLLHFNGTTDSSDDVKFNKTILSFRDIPEQTVIFPPGLLFDPGQVERIVLEDDKEIPIMALGFGARCSQNATLEVRMYLPDCQGIKRAGSVRTSSSAVQSSERPPPYYPLGSFTYSSQSTSRDWETQIETVSYDWTIVGEGNCEYDMRDVDEDEKEVDTEPPLSEEQSRSNSFRFLLWSWQGLLLFFTLLTAARF